MCIKSDAKNKQHAISDLVVWGKRIKQNGNYFHFNFSVESSSFKVNNFKTEKFTLTFKGWNRPVGDFCLVLPECLSVISPSDSEVNRDGSDAESPFPLFFSLSASFKNSSRFGTGRPSLCLYPLLFRNIIFCPALTMAAREKKKILAKRFAHAISVSVQYRDF